MKIVCESCGAKYSIADDRVTGKVFKIRCKRCSEVIIVRGDQPAQAAAEPAQAAPDQQAIWHVVVDGEQAGPYAPPQLAEMLSAGTVDWDAYVWTEGFDNWLPMRDVPDLVAQITGGGQPQAAAQPRAAQYRSAVQETLTGQPSMGADPFADDAPADGGLFGGGAAAGGELFGRSPAASPFASGSDSGVVASAPSPRVDAAQAMTGARNENSVLFSLKNLQALATGGSGAAGAAVPSAAPSDAGRTGYAGGEGSGLIDIRALASATGVGESSNGAGSRDELLSIGSQGGAFGTLGSPMLAPAAADDSSNKKTLIWAGVAGLAFVSAAAVAIIYIMRTPPPVTAPAPAVAVAAQAPPNTALTATQPSQPQTEPPSEGERAAKAATESKENDDENTRAESRRRERDRDRDRERSSSGSSTRQESEPVAKAPTEKKEAPPSKPSGPRSIDDLLEGALSSGGSPKPKAEASQPSSNLPEQPTRDQVISAMNAVKPAVSACAQGQGGVATVTVSVAGATGRVTNATVAGVTGPTGSCVAQAVRKAQFPKFQAKVFKVQFPFKL